MKEIKELCDEVRQIAYDIHVYHGHGHLEKVYENALAHRLRKAGIAVEQQHPVRVYDEDGTLIGDYLADLVVEGCLIIELKTAKTLAPEHEAQVLGYLKSARLEHGLLINFGSYKFQIRKYAWTEGRPQRTQRPQRFFSLLFSAISVLFAVNPNGARLSIPIGASLDCAQPAAAFRLAACCGRAVPEQNSFSRRSTPTPGSRAADIPKRQQGCSSPRSTTTL